ncbi:MAG: bifunctional DNA primase/polymerase [Gemmataceae bacterium]|nr:bifunctional DNA primase/polymerase [Gemmataceae bacterium]
MNTPPDNLRSALEAAEKGYSPIPVLPGTKVPAVKWRTWQEELPPVELIRAWFAVRRNIAIVTRGIVVFDCDDPNVLDLVLDQAGQTPTICQTPHGFHAYYRRRRGVQLGNQVEIRGKALDVRTNGGLAMIPGSVNAEGKPYQWLEELLPADELPVAKIGWIRAEPKRKPKIALPDSIPADISKVGGKIRDIFAYLLKIPSVEGQYGSKGAFRVACILRCEGYSPEEALEIMRWWNQQPIVQPPWSEAELRHKIRDAYRKARGG